MLPTKFWAEMKWRDFSAADMTKVVAVLPVAAIEQHGPHLPVGVDTFINEGYLAARRRARFPTICRRCSCPSRRSASRTSTSNFPAR